MSSIDSHIQMPKFILRNFENDKHFVSFYDVCKKKYVKKGHAKSINTEKDYYSPGLEKKMNNEVEAPFSRIVQKSIDLFSTPNIDEMKKTHASPFTENEELIWRQFFYLLFARDPNANKSFFDKSELSAFYSKTQNDDFVVTHSMNLLCEFDQLSAYQASVCINNTSTPFLLTSFGLIFRALNGNIHIILPVSPTIALSMFRDTNSVKNESVKPNLVFEIDDLESIYELNFNSINKQIGFGCGYICSNNYHLLKSYVDTYFSSIQSHI